MAALPDFFVFEDLRFDVTNVKNEIVNGEHRITFDVTVTEEETIDRVPVWKL